MSNTNSRWRNDGVRIVRAGHLDSNTPQTAGMQRRAAVTTASTGAKQLWAGTVTIDARPHDGGLEVAVTDTGIGINPEVLPVIFQPFRQGDRGLTRRHGGAGLGLYVARCLLDALGGRITVASTPGRGSTVRIWVPSSGIIPAQHVQGRAA